MKFLLLIYDYYLSVCGLLSPWQWSIMLMFCISGTITGAAACSGWGGVDSRWQVILIGVCGMLTSSLSGLVLAAAALWSVGAYAATLLAFPSQNVTAGWLRSISYFKFPLCVGIGGGFLIGTAIWFILRRHIQPRITQALGVGVVEIDGLTDARTVEKNIPKAIRFDPRKYFAGANKIGHMFLGLDQFGKAVTIARDVWKKTHVQILGPTGTGKGVMACCCLAQSIANDDGVYVIDPKDDEYAPLVLREACENVGKPFHLINLRRGQPAQIDMLKGISKEDLNSLFIAGFGLGEKGTDADFYRKNDRAAARCLAVLADKGPVSLTRLAERAGVELPDDLADKCEGFRRSLEEVSELEAVQAPAGSIAAELDGPIKTGGCIYVVGSMDDEAVVVLQRMLLLRIVQLVSARPRDGKQRHVTIFSDEIRYQMSKKLGDVLGSVRDKGCNLILAHQSLDDLKTGDVPSPAVVIDNTGLRWLYRSSTEEMAQWIAGQTGKILVNKSSQKIEKNAAGGQVGKNEAYMSQVERQKIDVNMVQHLPNGVAVVIGAGPARLAFSSPVPVFEKLDASQLVKPAKMSAVRRVEPRPAPKPKVESPTDDVPFSSFLDDVED